MRKHAASVTLATGPKPFDAIGADPVADSCKHGDLQGDPFVVDPVPIAPSAAGDERTINRTPVLESRLYIVRIVARSCSKLLLSSAVR